MSETARRWREERRGHAEWKAARAAGRLAGLREAAEVVRKFGEAALKCGRCGDIRHTYAPGGCTGEAQYRETHEFKTEAMLYVPYDAIRYFEKHLCRPHEMERAEMVEAMNAAILALATSKDTPKEPAAPDEGTAG